MGLADIISIELRSWFDSRRDFVVSNLFVDWYEADVIKITKDGLMYEYEIKTTKSDFKSDSKKRTDPHGRTKHEKLIAGKLRPNKFFFVVPEGLVDKSEVPAEFGLIYWYNVDNTYTQRFRIVKQAKPLHDRRNVDWFDMARLAGFKLHMRQQKDNRKLQQLKKEL